MQDCGSFLSHVANSHILTMLLVCLAVPMGCAMAAPSDLNPVTMKPAPSHAPVLLVENGQPRASVCVMDVPNSREFESCLKELQECIKEATGAELPVVKSKIPDGPAIVIGACDEAKKAGLDGAAMPVEGFIIKTAPNRVFIVGHDDPKLGSPGTAWGVYEFLERVVNVRFYWPAESGGRHVPRSPTLSVSAMWIEDAPVYRKRDNWPTTGPLIRQHSAMRCADTWPVHLVVHSPRWGWGDRYTKKTNPEVYELRKDGSCDDLMICYGNPKTLEVYLEVLSRAFDKKEKVEHNEMGIVGDSITVSPWDKEVRCYCKDCQRLWNEKAGPYGTASKIMADFVVRLATEVKKRWPDKTVIFLPYLNYTWAPDGYTFPDNVEVQICGMPGIAQYKEPQILAAFQQNIDRWRKLTNRKVQTWEYSCWPEDRTKAPYQYPHVVKAYYQANRDKLVGSFINGMGDHWPRQNISMYAWLKCLWNPDFDVDAMMEEFCNRMFGPAAKTMRELLRIQVDGWEKSRWPDATLSAMAIYQVSYPPETVKRMFELLAQARREAGTDQTILKRLDYYETPFADFRKEYEFIVEGKGVRPLLAKKVGELPAVDGKLDGAAWQNAPPVAFKKYDAEKNAEADVIFPTELRAVWTQEAVVFGFRMTEPKPQALRGDNQTRDDGALYWQDCIEVIVDPSGDNSGKFYHFILTAGGAVYDAFGEDATWNCEGLRFKSATGPNYWTMEVYVPLKSLNRGKTLPPGTGVQWYGQFCRNRLSDGDLGGGHKGNENQKLNARQGGFNFNTGDFAPIQFVE